MYERIVLIGAGSAVFTRGLIADLIRLHWTADVALVDVDPSALDVAQRLAAKMVAATNAPITLRATTERRDALPGATVVICTVGVGGRRAWEQDVFTPRKYGIYAPVGDTVGPGGSSRSLRMIPVMVDIARDVLDLAPDALFFNYGNPMAPICRAIRKATGANVTGLCHGVVHVVRYLAHKLDVQPNQLQYTAVGINHLTWFTSVRSDGEDAMGQLRAIAADKAASPLRRATPNDNPFESLDDDPFSWWLMHLFGAFPAVLDRHVTEFFPQFFRDGSYWGCKLGVDTFHFEGTIAEGDETFAAMRSAAYDPAPMSPASIERGEGEHEQVMDIIDSIRHDRSLVFSANLPNTGQVSNLPLQAIVESPCVANGEGLRPITLGALPSGIVGTLATRYQWVETIVEAALERSRDKFILALVLDGAVSSVDQAVALADDLLAVQAAHLEGWESERVMPKPFDLVVVGDINADLILSGDVTPAFGQVEKLLEDASLVIGGSATIFACGAARLGLRVAVVGKVGEDVFGHFLLDALRKLGIDTSAVVRDTAIKTGLTVILSRGQDRAMLTHAGTIGALHYAEIDLDFLGVARHLHMGSYFLLEKLLPDVPRLFAEAQRRGLTISLDTNYDPAEQWNSGLAETLRHVDIFLPNQTELSAITRTPDWSAALVQAAAIVPTVVVKLGGDGAAVQQGGNFLHQPVLPVEVVDTTGAGDSFDAGFVYGHLAGWSLERTLRMAMACGACSTQATGGTAAQPDLEQALALAG